MPPQLAGSFYKGTPSPRSGLRLLVGARFQVLFPPLSGCFSPFPHGTGSLSVTGECSALGWSPGSHRVSRARRYSGAALTDPARIRVQGSHPVPPAFPGRSASARICNCDPWSRGPMECAVHNPRTATPSSLRAWVWAGAVSLAATPAISVDFSSSGYLDVSVPGLPPRALFHSGAGSRT